jgi:hypothetical protein
MAPLIGVYSIRKQIPSNWELWIDGSQDNATIHRNVWSGADMEDFADPLPLLASYRTGSLDGRLMELSMASSSLAILSSLHKSRQAIIVNLGV